MLEKHIFKRNDNALKFLRSLANVIADLQGHIKNNDEQDIGEFERC